MLVFGKSSNRRLSRKCLLNAVWPGGTVANYRCRLVLYYPVSALVTLFANILQNPQDARARGDLRLMSSVCSFLTMLERDAAEANGNVRRMLSVCSEFERIARVVLDKAEREMRGGRGKRKAAERDKAKEKDKDDAGIEKALDEGKSLEQMQVETQAKYRRPIQTPSLKLSQGGSGNGDSPVSWDSPAGGTGPEYRTPSGMGMETGAFQQPQQANSGQWNPQVYGTQNGNTSYPQQQDIAGNGQSPPQPSQFTQPPLTDTINPSATGMGLTADPLAGLDPMTTAPGAFNISPDMANGAGSFQQPFVPQDLWQMPMTLEWDWAEGLGLGSFTPGPMFDEYGLGGSGMDVGQGQPHQQ